MTLLKQGIRTIKTIDDSIHKHAYIASAILILLSSIYLYASAISVLQIEEDGRNVGNHFESRSAVNTMHTFSATIDSKLSQSILLNIVAQDEIKDISVNGEPVPPLHQYKEGRTSDKNAVYGDTYKLNVTKGVNVITIRSLNKGEPYSIAIGQQRSIVEYLLLSLAFILPFSLILLKNMELLVHKQDTILRVSNKIPFMVYIISSAIVLRLFYFYSIGYIQFQHDYDGHIEFIQFFAENFSIPMAHKGWEFPQQPLYYIVSGSIYKLGDLAGFSKDQLLFFISGLSCVLSCIGLIYAYRLIKLLSENVFVHYLAIGFLAFTPSLIYMSSRINNDSMAASLAIVSLYYIVAGYQNQFQKYFTLALIWSSLTLLTKVSAVIVWLVFFILLISHYVKSPLKMRTQLFHYTWVGLLLLGFILFKSYSAAAGEFLMVNSGIWPGQDLRPLDADYLFSFNFSELLNRAHAYWGDKETTLISRSFFTYQYGTMLFGEFDYAYWKGLDQHLALVMQIIIVLGMLIPAGLIVSIFRKKHLIEFALLFMLVANFALVIKFVFAYPSTSNTDFRYYAPCLFAFAYLMATGLDSVASRHMILRKTLYGSMSVLFLFEALFIGLLST